MPIFNLTVNIADGGALLIAPLNDGELGASILSSNDWPEGFDIAQPFTVPDGSGNRNFDRSHCLFLRVDTGDVHIHRIENNGKLSARQHYYNWRSGWTIATFFTVSGNTFLLILKRSDGKVHIYRMEPDGEIGDIVVEDDWQSGWTQVRSFVVGSVTYLFRLKSSTGLVHILRINDDGTLGESVAGYDWKKGWSIARFFRRGENTFLFILKGSDGAVHIYRMNNDGSIGPLVFEANWSNLEISPLGIPTGGNWTQAEFYNIGDQTYLFLLKELTGDIHIHRMNANGTVGTRTFDKKLSSGWTAISSYQTPLGTFLLRQKKLSTRPLRRTFVEHLAFGVPVGLYITNDNGDVRDENDDSGIDSLGTRVDIRVICHNSVIRIQNILIDHWRDFTGLRDNAVVTIRPGDGNYERFRVINRCLEAYENVFRPLDPFKDFGDFPSNRSGNLQAKRDAANRIEVAFPDWLPQPLAFVEPKELVIHFKAHSEDPRLLGGNGFDPTLIPGELAHALHFSLLSDTQRDNIQSQFGRFFSGELSVNGDLTHSLKKETNPTVAFLEALDHFAGRFAMFLRNTPGRAIDDDFYLAFIRDQFEVGDVAKIADDAPAQFDVQRIAIDRVNELRTASVEGAVYGAIYLDWARRPGIGLRNAVSAVLRSKKTTFGQFKTWVESNEEEWFNELEQVADKWDM